MIIREVLSVAMFLFSDSASLEIVRSECINIPELTENDFLAIQEKFYRPKKKPSGTNLEFDS